MPAAVVPPAVPGPPPRDGIDDHRCGLDIDARRWRWRHRNRIGGTSAEQDRDDNGGDELVHDRDLLLSLLMLADIGETRVNIA